jgi:hypothetical protein
MESTKVSIKGWMNKDNVYTYKQNIIWPSKELNPVICGNIDGTRSHCVKWKELGTEKKSFMFWSYEEAENVDFIELDNRVVVTRN